MNSHMFIRLTTFLFVLLQVPFAAIRTVSKDGSGQYTTITGALSDAQEGDEVVIIDYSTFNEQVTINKNRITLRSEIPNLAKKPIIQYQDVTNTGPKTLEEANETTQKYYTFDQNGAVRVMRCQGVVIDGITIDGGGPAPFCNEKVYGGKDPLFHGNASLTLLLAGDVTVRNCDLRNSYFGIYVKDRNEGGIFAISNPADLDHWRVVPLSGFAKTGNHLFEYNKIHDNSWGTFFESAWDLGSTIRYNLYYENHHKATLGPVVKGMGDGANQPGGAFLFKDMILSPVAIYNNTFWHNHTLFSAHWKAGSQYLIFNNIYAEPYVFWSKNPDFPNPFLDYTANFVNRMKNCLFACQMQKPDAQTQNVQWNIQDPDTNVTDRALVYKLAYSFTSRVAITNDILVSEKAGLDIVMKLTLSKGRANERDTTTIWHEALAIQPGALIYGATAAAPYPKDANNRWLEPIFLSTDPTDPRFLTPDWENPVMKQYIVDQGWPEGGIRDADGSIADIGAISYTAKRPESVVLIIPTEPIRINGTVATAVFNLTTLAGAINNPVIQYVKWIDLPTFKGTEFGPSATKLVPGTNISSVTPSISTVKEGLNKFTFTVAARNKTNAFGFLEIVIEGTNAKGDTVTSNAGFLPYRALDYRFDVQVFDRGLTRKLDTVRVGDTVMLKVIPKDSTGNLLSSVIDTAEASLGSSFDLINDKMQKFTLPRGLTQRDSIYPVVFTRVPPDGALENVSVSGKFLTSTVDSIGNVIRGTSDGIKILPGPADHVLFCDPPSKGVKYINPGVSVTIVAKVYDKFGNRVGSTNNGEKNVILKSMNTAIGDVDGVATQIIDDAGSVYFKVKVTGGNERDTFPIVATLSINADTAKCVVCSSIITAVKSKPHNEPAPKVEIKVHPEKVRMEMQYGPNPFRPASGEMLTIEFAPELNNNPLTLSGTIRIFDCVGHLVKTQSTGKSSGKHRIRWDGKNMDGRVVSTGTYYLKLNIVNENAKKDLNTNLPAGILIGVKR